MGYSVSEGESLVVTFTDEDADSYSGTLKIVGGSAIEGVDFNISHALSGVGKVSVKLDTFDDHILNNGDKTLIVNAVGQVNYENEAPFYFNRTETITINDLSAFQIHVVTPTQLPQSSDQRALLDYTLYVIENTANYIKALAGFTNSTEIIKDDLKLIDETFGHLGQVVQFGNAVLTPYSALTERLDAISRLPDSERPLAEWEARRDFSAEASVEVKKVAFETIAFEGTYIGTAALVAVISGGLAVPFSGTLGVSAGLLAGNNAGAIFDQYLANDFKQEAQIEYEHEHPRPGNPVFQLQQKVIPDVSDPRVGTIAAFSHDQTYAPIDLYNRDLMQPHFDAVPLSAGHDTLQTPNYLLRESPGLNLSPQNNSVGLIFTNTSLDSEIREHPTQPTYHAPLYVPSADNSASSTAFVREVHAGHLDLL